MSEIEKAREEIERLNWPTNAVLKIQSLERLVETLEFERKELKIDRDALKAENEHLDTAADLIRAALALDKNHGPVFEAGNWRYSVEFTPEVWKAFSAAAEAYRKEQG